MNIVDNILTLDYVHKFSVGSKRVNASLMSNNFDVKFKTPYSYC